MHGYTDGRMRSVLGVEFFRESDDLECAYYFRDFKQARHPLRLPTELWRHVSPYVGKELSVAVSRVGSTAVSIAVTD